MKERSSRAVKEMRVYACDVQSKAARTYLFCFIRPSTESMAHSEVIMTCEIKGKSRVLNSHIDGERTCHTGTGRLPGVHQGYKVAAGNRGRWQRGQLRMSKLLKACSRIVVDSNPRGQPKHMMKGNCRSCSGVDSIYAK